jgi:hypothetical protein
MVQLSDYQGVCGRGPLRDRLILCKALAYAMQAIQALPTVQQEYSDALDMRLMLDHMTKDFIDSEFFIENAKKHIAGTGF